MIVKLSSNTRFLVSRMSQLPRRPSSLLRRFHEESKKLPSYYDVKNLCIDFYKLKHALFCKLSSLIVLLPEYLFIPLFRMVIPKSSGYFIHYIQNLNWPCSSSKVPNVQFSLPRYAIRLQL